MNEREIRRLEVCIFTNALLYYIALALPCAVPIVYSFFCSRVKDIRLKFDERVFGATQVLTIAVTLYVCLMPFLLAMNTDISKNIFGTGDVFTTQNEAIWLIHSNLFRIMLLLFFRLMTIDMTLFQFMDWFLEQFDEEEEDSELIESE